MLAVIRVLTTDNPVSLEKHGRIITERFGIATRSYCIPDQFQGIYDDATERQAVPKIVEVVKQAERDGAQAVFISCAADPGLKEARANCRLPVIGAGSALATVGLALGERIGVLNLAGPTPAGIVSLLGSRLVAEETPCGVHNTTDLLAHKAEALTAAQALIRKGAEVILLACTGYSTIGLAACIAERFGCLTVDAVEAGGLMASYLYKSNSSLLSGGHT
ncbi:hypothetical protein SCACP_37440 [Sporomusa carbonis]|uniref:aspartate/glutamate racemase family protein n=1 Tax=Sporomusa carbonis TaxID=3076075 RepID=UPI003A752F44